MQELFAFSAPIHFQLPSPSFYVSFLLFQPAGNSVAIARLYDCQLCTVATSKCRRVKATRLQDHIIITFCSPVRLVISELILPPSSMLTFPSTVALLCGPWVPPYSSKPQSIYFIYTSHRTFSVKKCILLRFALHMHGSR